MYLCTHFENESAVLSSACLRTDGDLFHKYVHTYKHTYIHLRMYIKPALQSSADFLIALTAHTIIY